MRRIILMIIAVLAFTMTGLPAANVAVIYSSWPDGGKSYLEEFDIALGKIGCKYEKFENTKIPELTEKLAGFDMVAVTSVGNLEHTVELKPYAKAWKKYIAGGGILFICDANYTSVLQSFINHFGPDFELFSEHCSSHTKPSAANSLEKPGKDTLLYFPSPVFQTAAPIGHWSHLTKLPRGWTVLESCVDGKPLTVAKRYGKGLIVVTVHGALKDTAAGPFARDLFTNMLAYTALMKNGLSVVSAGMPSGIDKNIASVTLKCDRPELARRVNLEVNCTTKNGTGKTAGTVTTGDRIITLKAPIKFDSRGDVALQTTIMLDGKPVMSGNSSLHLPEYLAFKARRVHLYPDTAMLTVIFAVSPDDPKAKPVICWNIDGGTVQEIAVTKKYFIQNFDIAALPQGKHLLNLEYRENGKSIASYKQEFFKHRTPVVAVRSDGTLTRGGKPFFPIGFYHVSRNLPAESRMKMIKDIAEYGYNCVHVSIKADEKDRKAYTEFLDECEKRGIAVISEFSYDVLQSVRDYKKHPAVLGWNPGDEPAGNGTTPEEMFRRYSSIKQEDPDHIVYTVICIARQYRNYASGSDVLAPDPYPVPGNHVSDVFEIFSSAYKEARKYGTTLWGVPQTFGNCGSWTRTPTGQEYRAMVYLAFMAGIKGYIGYTYQDGGFYLPGNAELYEACKVFPTEIQELIPFLLEGKRLVLLNDRRGIYAASWELNGKRAYAVVNTSDKELAKPLSFHLRGDFSKYRIAAGKLDQISVSGTGLKATLAPMERVLIFCP